jgi:ELWxxDGT repeat protein
MSASTYRRRMTWQTLTRAVLGLVVAISVSSGSLAGSALAAPGDLNIAMVKDVDPGGSSGVFDLTNVNGTLFFVGTTPANGDELWKSDGTAAGTTMVKDINVTPAEDENCDCEELTNVNGTLFFAATDGTHGMELWKSNGTPAGTTMVADLNTSLVDPDSSPAKLTNVGGTLFFTADDGTGGRELWKSDGTDPGTTRVQDINATPAAGSDPEELTEVGGTVFFSADDGNSGRELWKTVGPDYSSATMVANINSTAGQGSNPYSLADFGGTLFFAADDGTHGSELWKSNGGALGPGATEMVEDINTTGTGVGSELGVTSHRPPAPSSGRATGPLAGPLGSQTSGPARSARSLPALRTSMGPCSSAPAAPAPPPLPATSHGGATADRSALGLPRSAISIRETQARIPATSPRSRVERSSVPSTLPTERSCGARHPRSRRRPCSRTSTRAPGPHRSRANSRK